MDLHTTIKFFDDTSRPQQWLFLLGSVWSASLCAVGAIRSVKTVMDGGKTYTTRRSFLRNVDGQLYRTIHGNGLGSPLPNRGSRRGAHPGNGKTRPLRPKEEKAPVDPIHPGSNHPLCQQMHPTSLARHPRTGRLEFLPCRGLQRRRRRGPHLPPWRKGTKLAHPLA